MERDSIVVYYGMIIRRTGGSYYLNGAFGRYIDELSKFYKKIMLVLPTKVDENCNDDDYRIISSNVVVQELPLYDGIVDALRKRRDIKKAIKKYAESWNSTVYIRWPTPFFTDVTRIAEKKLLPLCYHLVGDSEFIVKTGTKYRGIKRLFAILYSKHISAKAKKIIKTTPTLVNGDGLRRLYSTENPLIREIRTSTFHRDEIVYKASNINKKEINLLFVGYLRHEKGLPYLLEAVSLLNKGGCTYKLTIIGSGDKRDELTELTKALEITDSVKFLGYIPVGETLLNEYSKADIFILPSISEGTPRVLIEAMSRGVAVIATDTGGIPFTVKNGDNGILVPIMDSHAIANAVEKLCGAPDLFDKIVKNSYKFAYENTIEHHVDEVHNFIESYCLGKTKYSYYETVSKWYRTICIGIPVKVIQLLTGILPNSEPTNKLRGSLLRPFFKHAGRNLQVASGVVLNRIEQISVGKNVYLSHNAWLNGTGKIYIEDGVIVGPFCVVASTEHPFINGKVSNSGTITAPVRIGCGSWLASHAVATAGSYIGNGCLICANSVVNGITDDHCMYGGLPAKKIKMVGSDNNDEVASK